MVDPITDSDFIAFVDGQLDPMRRLEVEAHLAAHPQAAARVMADLHDRDALRASFRERMGPGPERNVALARRLDRSLRWNLVTSRLKRAAAIAVLVGAGWLAHDEIGRFGVPDTMAATVDASLVDDARQARMVARLRAATAADGTAYDRERLRTVTGVELPPLPEGWKVRDLQVFPSRHGTGIEVTFEADLLGEVSLFATRADGRTGPAMLGDTAEGRVLAWTTGGNAYAVSGPVGDAVLQRAAGLLGG
jgi:anti-sigma factor RsiW